jgi:cytoskeletal protein CcmA (bactofilin family)
MWNKRPEEELPKSFNPPVAGGAPARVTPNPTEAKKETTPMFITPTAKADVELSRGGSAVIGKAVKIVGEIYSNEDLFIEGFVEGTVEALDQKLTVGHNGTVHASVQVRELEVQGTVQGNVEASDRIEIRKDAKLVGDIRAARIVIEDGAYFKGSIDIVRPEAAAKPLYTPPAAAPMSAKPVAEAATEAAFELLVSSR